MRVVQHHVRERARDVPAALRWVGRVDRAGRESKPRGDDSELLFAQQIHLAVPTGSFDVLRNHDRAKPGVQAWGRKPGELLFSRPEYQTNLAFMLNTAGGLDMYTEIDRQGRGC